MTTTHKFEIEVWKKTGDFNLWCQNMRALLLQQRCVGALNRTWSTEISAYRKLEIDGIAWITIFLHLSDSVIRKIGETTTIEALWTKLRSLYLTKIMPNKCYLLR